MAGIPYLPPFSHFSFNDTATTAIYTLSLHDALPILPPHWPATTRTAAPASLPCGRHSRSSRARRSEEHTSELQSHSDLVCRLLLEKKKKKVQRSSRKVRDRTTPASAVADTSRRQQLI